MGRGEGLFALFATLLRVAILVGVAKVFAEGVVLAGGAELRDVIQDLLLRQVLLGVLLLLLFQDEAVDGLLKPISNPHVPEPRVHATPWPWPTR